MNKTELANMMLKGLSNPEVSESAFHYIGIDDLDNILEQKPCMACALGCALIGKYDRDYLSAKEMLSQTLTGYHFDWDDEIEVFAYLLEIPEEVARTIERKHLDNQSIKDIAKWLKSEEQEVPA